MRFKFPLILFLCLLALQLRPNPVLDSLYKAYLSAENPSKKISLLLAYSYQLRNVNLDSAMSCVRKAYEQAVEMKNEGLQAEAAVQFAMAEVLKSNYRAALKYYFMAANQFKKVKNNEGLSKCYTGMGITYWYQGLHNQAVDYFIKNIEISRKLGDEEGMASSFGNLAIIFDERNQPDSSLKYYTRALDIFRRGGDPLQVASCYDNMSLLFVKKNDFKSAMQYHTLGYDIRKNLADTFGIMASLENLGHILIKQGKPDKAIEVSNRVLLLARMMEAKEDMKYAYANLKDAYAMKGDYKLAFENQNHLIHLKDSLREEENLNQSAELEARFRNKEKEAELSEIKLEQKLKEKENETQNRKKNFAIVILVIGGVSFLLIAFLLFRRFKEKQKVANELKLKNDAISAQKIIIDKAYEQLAEKNKDITDSIRYAQRIQQAIFPPDKFLKQLLPDSFVMFRPKDIVSGDFYYTEQLGDDVYFAVVDCTGHGVPGALMSIVGFNLISKALHEFKKTSPAAILNQMNLDLNETLRQTIEESQVKDGMEMTLCRWNRKKNEFVFAAANHVLYQIRNGNLITHKGDKHPIGGFYGEQLKQFTEQTVDIAAGDCFYMVSDGFADQFGGPKGKKFKYKQLEEHLLALHRRSMEEQKSALETIFVDWKGNLEQVDDVLLFGVRV